MPDFEGQEFVFQVEPAKLAKAVLKVNVVLVGPQMKDRSVQVQFRDV